MKITHIRVNNGDFSGVEIACNKADFGFTLTSTTTFAAISTDVGNNAFMNQWIDQNLPDGSDGMDDITSYNAIPEFSTLLMPIASVLLIVGNKIRNKKTYQQ